MGGRLEETKRVARILRIMESIACYPSRFSRLDLARAYGISERQIQNDLMVIRHGLCLPLRRAEGGYYFEGGVRIIAISPHSAPPIE